MTTQPSGRLRPYPSTVAAADLVAVQPGPVGTEVHRLRLTDDGDGCGPVIAAPPCGRDLSTSATWAAAACAAEFGVLTWCATCFTTPTPPPSTVDDDPPRLVCGCPYRLFEPAGHKSGCWMATVEAIAVEAYCDAPSGAELVGVLAALTEGGYLRVPDSEGELLTLLDALAEGNLLGPPTSPGGSS